MENISESYNNVSTLFINLGMIKSLTTVGNSKAVILPSQMIKKYGLEDQVLIEETEEGILIRPVLSDSTFQKRIEKLKNSKPSVYKRMELQAGEPDTMKYYASSKNNLSGVDPEIID